ncbi:MAG: glycosyltransferase family 9 protein [Bacteroidales bacterium]|nr:glycosyltransferase family 9 protein [Bacteroidales bacterium]MCF8333192.1 glycosyltransferase family 9 protein [Bacteroidales bacterium]
MMSLSKKDFQKILIIQTASIGDVILATPVLEKLKAHYPEAKIDFLMREGSEPLLRGHPHIRAILSWNKSENKYNNLTQLLGYIRDRKYDLVVNLQRFLSTGILTAFSGAKVTAGFNKNPLSLFFSNRVKHQIGLKYPEVHEIDRNLKVVDFLNDTTRYKPRLYPGKKAYAKISQYRTQNYITITPASIWYTKQYPVDKWVQFINNVPPEYHVYILGAKNDRVVSDEIVKKTRKTNILDLCGQFTLLESAALIAGAEMNYANDSAAQHMASAMNAPVTTVYCSTVPEFGFGPLSDDSKVIQTDEKLDCRPCGLHGYNQCPEGHFKCADIDSSKLLKRLEK